MTLFNAKKEKCKTYKDEFEEKKSECKRVLREYGFLVGYWTEVRGRVRYMEKKRRYIYSRRGIV